MNPKNLRLWPCLLVALGLLLAGCAVVTVDVDVYKGPLANHEDIQLQQAVVMAAGAKPLLVRLRDALECGSQRPEDLAEFRNANKDWYSPGFISLEKCRMHLQNDQSLRVNDILALYENEKRLIRDLLNLIERELEEAIANYKTFQFESGDHVIWQTATNGNLWNAESTRATSFAYYTLGDNSATNTAAKAKSVSRSYTYRPTPTDFQATNMAFITQDLSPEKRARVEDQLKEVMPLLPRNYSANHTFLWLTNRALVKAHSDALFKTRTPAVVQLEDRWCQLAQAFLQGRSNLREAIGYSLWAINEVAHSTSGSAVSRKALIQELAELTAFIINFEQVSLIAFTEPSFTVSGIKAHIVKNVPNALREIEAKRFTLGLSRAERVVILQNFLMNDPGPASTELLEAHRAQLRGAVGRPSYPFGIGDTLNEKVETNRVQEFVSQAQKSARAISDIADKIDSGSGLDGGRLGAGLDKLTRNFLNTSGEDKDKAKVALLEELARFAEKILFLANNDVLMRPAHWRGLPRTIGRWGVGSTVGFNYLSEPPDGETYSKVLQVIANSILVEVDELYQRRQYKTNESPMRVQQASAAFTRAYDANAEGQLALWRRQLQGAPFSTAAYDKHVAELDTAKSNRAAAERELDAATTQLTTASNAVVKFTGFFNTFTNQVTKGLFAALADTTKDGARKFITNSLATFALSQTGEERERVAKLKEWLATTTLSDGAVTTTVADVLKGYVQDVGEALLKAEAELPPAKSTFESKKTTFDQAEAAWKKAKDEVDKDEVARRNTAALAELNRLATTDFVTQNPIPRNLWEALLRQARAEPKANTNAPFLADFLQTAKPVSDRIPGPRGHETESKQVLDQLIASLRYEHTRAILEEGKDSKAANQIAEALSAALEQRAGMIYIRPAASYLRTSFPSTSLQQGTKVGWRNMLAEHGRRQLPFASLFENTKKVRALQEIDQQFWQNVNQVRVAGAGSANYVIAKDDLGNWYVKNYSADPGRIIKSAQNLAMFSLGPQLGGAALPIQSGSTGALLAGATNGASMSQGPVGAQLDKTVADYNAKTLETYKAMSSQATGALLGQAMLAAWKAASLTNANGTALEEVEKSARKSIIELPATLPEKKIAQDEIISALRGLNRYRSGLLTGAARLPDKADRETAEKAIDAVLQPVIDQFLNDRIETVNQMRERVGVLSELGRK